MIETVVVEDSPLAQRYLVSLVEAREGFHLAEVFEDAFRAEQYVAVHGADLVLMDVMTRHNHSGLAAGERLRKRPGAPKVVAVTSLIDPDILARARAGAADSLWYKDHGGRELWEVVDRTLAGERVFPEAAPSVELNEMFSGDISPRQMAILRRFVRGMTYEEIAEELKLTKRGVRWNITALTEKGGFQNRYELLAALVQNKLIVTTLLDEEK